MPDWPEILNKRTARDWPATAVYVGRPGPWGNPFSVGAGRTREQAIAQHLARFLAQPALMARAKRELRGRALICWCWPKPCHAEVLRLIANC